MDLAFTLFAFLLAGLVKGTVGLGLPLVSIALLTPVLGLAEAKALMLVPAALTNLVQAPSWRTPRRRPPARCWVRRPPICRCPRATRHLPSPLLS